MEAAAEGGRRRTPRLRLCILSLPCKAETGMGRPAIRRAARSRKRALPADLRFRNSRFLTPEAGPSLLIHFSSGNILNGSA
jgi:hypothetical protein